MAGNVVIQEITCLRELNRSNEAYELLNRSAKVVAPVLERRKWRIHHLTEFFPDNPSLLGLNINQGLQIKIRLRSPHNINEFLSFEDILGTLIHEITHIAISPHSAEFYQLMESLSSEVEKDMMNGVDREGNLRFAAFTGVARKLGTSGCCGQSNTLDKRRLRDIQVQSALRREKQSKLSVGSGQKLGRGEPTTSSANLLRSGIPQSSPLLQLSPTATSSMTSTSTSSSQQHSISTTDQNRRWLCSQCTFLNPITLSQCEMCCSPRKSNEKSHSNPIPVTTTTTTTTTPPTEIIDLGDDDDFNSGGGDEWRDDNVCMWVCSRCTFANEMTAGYCMMCEVEE